MKEGPFGAQPLNEEQGALAHQRVPGVDRRHLHGPGHPPEGVGHAGRALPFPPPEGTEHNTCGSNGDASISGSALLTGTKPAEALGNAEPPSGLAMATFGVKKKALISTSSRCRPRTGTAEHLLACGPEVLPRADESNNLLKNANEKLWQQPKYLGNIGC